MGTKQQLAKVGKVTIPAGALAAVIVALLAPHRTGLSGENIAQYVATFLTAVTAAIHGPKAAKAVGKKRKQHHKPPQPQPHTGPIAMYDSIEVSTVPDNPPAVAGYVGGSWPDYNALVRKFPHAHHLSIAPQANMDADCLDVETGDATPQEAPAWVRRQHQRGIARPCVYANLSTMPSVWAALKADGIQRDRVRLWVAEWTYQPHIPSGYDACQWTDRALGRNLDESLCSATFFD